MDRRLFIRCVAVFALAAAILWLPWATEKRTVVSSTPVPPALFGITPAPLGPGQTACMQQVTLDPSSQIAEIGVDTKKKPGPPLDVKITGPGYSTAAHIPAGYTDTPALHFDMTPPKHALIGQLCFRNAGKAPMSLNGTSEFRTTGRPSLTIDGAPQPYDAQLKLYRRGKQSFLGRTGTIFSHAAVFTPGFLPAFLIGLLFLLALAGIPAAVFAALASAARSDEDRGR